MDLLTTVLHEMGHLAGLPDMGGSGQDGDLMSESLAPGVRKTQALDQVFSDNTSGYVHEAPPASGKRVPAP
jgi:hypothetical protein